MNLKKIGEGIKILKQIEVFNALDKNGALIVDKIGNKVAYRLKTKEELIKDKLIIADDAGKLVRENFPNAAGAIDQLLAGMIIATGKELNGLLDVIRDTMDKPHGSKVKAGRFCGCRIVYAGSMSYIEVGKDLFLYLTPDCVDSVRYVKKKFRAKKMKKYYYYEIIFKDGSESYVRVSKKHRENLNRCNIQEISGTIFKELPAGESYIDDEEEE